MMKRKDMDNIKLTPKDIYEMDFATKMRGYDKDEVDEMLDDVMADYEIYQKEILKLQEENEFLKNKTQTLEKQIKEVATQSNQANPANLDETQRLDAVSQVFQKRSQKNAEEPKQPSNFDLLKRINRLEHAVFGTNSSLNN